MSTSGNNGPTQQPSGGSLRPPTSRPGHHLRASADMSGAFSSPMGGRIRPSSEIFLNPPQIPQQNAETEALDKAAREWINDLEAYENTIEEMANAALDQEFKDELSAIEQWFRVLSEAERTAALYALLQQTTQVQIRFFIQVLQQMAKSHPMSNLLSPSTFEKDAMTNRMNDAMSKISIGSNRDSFGSRPPPPSPGPPNRNSTVDPAAMFPEAAAAIAAQRSKLSGQGGAASGVKSNRNSALFETRSSSNNLNAPPLSTSGSKENNPPSSPWNRPNDQSSANNENVRPKSASGQPAMGNFQLPPPSAGLRSPRNPPPQINSNTNIQTTTLAAPSNDAEMPQLSPYHPSGGNWASMVNTPVTAIFPPGANNADMVANATAMKLAALSTVNNRIILDNDPKGWGKRRKDSVQGSQNGNNGMASPRGIPAISPAQITMYNEHGQLVHINAAAAAAALQQQQGGSPNMLGGRSRPSSPGVFNPPAAQWGQMGFASPQANGFLAAQSPLLNNGLLGTFGSLGGSEGYHSDDMNGGRGRSPRGRRGSSKPPEDPTNPELLNDIPQWLRSLRLHKYTDNLKDLKWQELIELDDEALDKRGVNALGARRKMQKVFEQVKAAQSEGKL